MSDSVPIPSQALEIATKMKASNVINKMKLENIILKHLVDMLDPEHDYIMDLDKMSIQRVKRDVKVQSSSSKKPERREKSLTGGKTRGFNVNDRRSFAPGIVKREDSPEEEFHPTGDQ